MIVWAGHPIDTQDLKAYSEGVDVSVVDLKSIRGIFNHAFQKSKFNVIATTTIIADRELPAAVSSLFHIELSPDGALINDLSPDGYRNRVKPCFMTIFPQEGKTYCLVSYFRRDRKDFEFLKDFSISSEATKEALISNLIIVYTENFVIKPSFWRNLDDATKSKYGDLYESLILSLPRSFTFDADFSLFN